MADQKRSDHVSNKQIELNREDIYAVEKPASSARLVKAPEHFVSQELIADINANGLDETRRGFLRKGFLSAIGGAAAGLTAPIAFAAGEGDPAILENKNGKLLWVRMWRRCPMVCLQFMRLI